MEQEIEDLKKQLDKTKDLENRAELYDKIRRLRNKLNGSPIEEPEDEPNCDSCSG